MYQPIQGPDIDWKQSGVDCGFKTDEDLCTCHFYIIEGMGLAWACSWVGIDGIESSVADLSSQKVLQVLAFLSESVTYY